MEQCVSKLEDDMTDVRNRLAVAEASLKDGKEDIRSIKKDTKLLRRSITNVIIGAVIVALIGIVFAALKGDV